MKKKLPIGIENFKDVALDCYYVDKTMLIKDILDLPFESVVLFTRPRRFGKSLALSMIQTFFEQGQDSHKYFEGKKIMSAGKQYLAEMNNNPVIRITMKDVKGTSYDNLLAKVREIISREYFRHKEVLQGDKLSDNDKKYFNSILNSTVDETSLSSSLERLTYYMNLYYGKRTIVLIDEYDSPIDESHQNGFYDQAINFFRAFYSEALKGNDNIKFGIVSGVLQVAKESIISGLNNLLVSTITTPAFSQYFGFTEAETKELLEYYNKGESLQDVLSWYGGYRFGDENIVNPWSVLSFARLGVLEPHWANTGKNAVLGELLTEGSDQTVLSLNSLFSGEKVFVDINTAVDYKNLSSTRNMLFSFLAAAGYLSCSTRVSGITFEVRIPNKEIEAIFTIEIQDRFIPSNESDSFYLFKDAFLKGDVNQLTDILQSVLLSSFSYYEFTDEKNYQVLMLTISTLLFNNAVVKSEVISGKGRCDVMISPKLPNNPGLIIDIKHFKSITSEVRLKEESKKAIKQIKENDYKEELVLRKANPILAYGIVFYQKKAVVAFEKIEE